MGRPRKIDAVRDASGKSRDDAVRRKNDYEQTIGRRMIELAKDDIDPLHARDQIAGFTLGRLLLRYRADRRDPSGIDQKQYEAGIEWTNIVHRHAGIMGYKLNVPSPSFQMVNTGISCAKEPTDEEIAEIRNKWRVCYDALMETVCAYGNNHRISTVLYGVCIENWPLGNFSNQDFGLLRLGLNTLCRVLA